MKQRVLIRWVAIGCAGTLLACGGASKKNQSTGRGGSTGETPMGTSGSGGTHAEVGGQAGGAPPDGRGGTKMGTGGSSLVSTCKRDADCTEIDPECELCNDGRLACSRSFCQTGQCKYVKDTCNTSTCSADADCPASTIECTACEDGSEACPVVECVRGECEQSFPRCAGGEDPCEGLECGAECDPCVSGASCDAPARSYCDLGGQCSSGIPQCSPDVSLCTTAMDCPAPPPNCIDCGNGTCASTSCQSGKCSFGCPDTNQNTCTISDDCPAVGEACTMCPNLKCAVPACVGNACLLVCPL